MSKRSTTLANHFPAACIAEVSWEVCNQVGGIYTVIRSKAPAMVKHANGPYCMVGPYVNKNIHAELEPLDDSQDVFGQAAAILRKKGFDVLYAEWLVTGKPRVVLLNPNAVQDKSLNVVKYLLWKNHAISTPADNTLINQVILFGYLVKLFFDELVKLVDPEHPIIAHFHEWMAGLPILDIKKERMPIKTIFTTHATQLGRHLAINSPMFYAHLPFFKWEEEAKRFGIETETKIEVSCAQHADVLSTVSEVTARECRHLLHRKPEVVVPNGLNIERFEALHEFQNQHVMNKEEIHRFVMAHFFQSYSFDLDKTLYFFTSGRYEYKNKGFDLTIEALQRLNARLKKEKSDITVVMFFVTRRDFSNIRPEVLQSKAMMQEIFQTTAAIQQQVGKRLFYQSTVQDDNHLPDLNTFVDEYWKLRYRRTLQAWKTKKNPLVVTHRLINEEQDEVLQALQAKKLLNNADDPVKVVYHPDFINVSSPLFGMDYNQFVRGCHLGIFPSYYEPWGYTPLECMASGIPSVTSDLSGFGDYILHHIEDPEKYGLFVIERGKRTFDWSAGQLTDVMYGFLMQSMRERIMQRNNVENNSSIFDWTNLIKHYKEAYVLATKNQP
ncbi:glycosyltransferase [Chryseolinea soli]|uniref:Glycosyltransferase n=1 Tax=Chryseolinea soli TaxID=2321403 RepID=A0A385SJD4_9BACT|nr:glycosyltransferase [Chryseolinea soli]AYB31359.1 glycosyltransferase [Chryseolinea soli]